MAANYYPPAGFHFKVKIGNSTASGGDASFQEVSGISSEITTDEIMEGGENRFSYRLPKSVNYSPLVLKRGVVVKNSDLDIWCRSTIESGFVGIQKKDITINLLDQKKDGQGKPKVLMTWSFYKAYPVKFEISNLNASNSEIVVATLQFVYTRYVQKAEA